MTTATHERLHARVERTTGADLRLIYGLGVPAAIATALIIATIVTEQAWLLPLVMLVVIVMVGVICVGMSQMLGEDGED
jgi:hypothetical protein